MALVLFANSQILADDLKEIGNLVEGGISIRIANQQDFEENTGVKVNNGERKDDHEHKDIQASLTETTSFDGNLIPLILILHNDFEKEANVATNPGNKAYVWLLMIIYSGIVAQSLHEQKDNIPGLSKKAREFCEKVLLSGAHEVKN